MDEAGPWSRLTILSKVNMALWGISCRYAKGWDPDASPSSWSALTLLLLPSVLGSRQIRLWENSLKFRAMIIPFQYPVRDQREGSDLTWGDPHLLED